GGRAAGAVLLHVLGGLGGVRSHAERHLRAPDGRAARVRPAPVPATERQRPATGAEGDARPGGRAPARVNGPSPQRSYKRSISRSNRPTRLFRFSFSVGVIRPFSTVHASRVSPTARGCA